MKTKINYKTECKYARVCVRVFLMFLLKSDEIVNRLRDEYDKSTYKICLLWDFIGSLTATVFYCIFFSKLKANYAEKKYPVISADSAIDCTRCT